MCCFYPSSASPRARSLIGSCCHLLSLSQDLLLQLSPIPSKSSILPLFNGTIFSSAHKHDWLSFMLKDFLWFPHPSPITAHFSASLHSLMSQNICLHAYLYFTFYHLKILKLCLFHFTKNFLCQGYHNLQVVKFNGQFIFSSFSLSCIRSRWPLLHHWFSSYLWCLWQFLLILCYRLSPSV